MKNMQEQRQVMWSIAGLDSGGGAGVSADQRTAEAFGIHLCPVTAAVTAQNTISVTHIHAIPPDVLEAQLDALAVDMPCAVIKTGMLGSAANARTLAYWLDQARKTRPIALVIDPVLRSSTGTLLANTELLMAYREWLLPRATVITPNRHEAAALLLAGTPHELNAWHNERIPTQDVPLLAQSLQKLGPQTVVITGGDDDDPLALDWLQSPYAEGWLSLPRIHTPHHHGTGCTFATAMGCAMTLGFVTADAAILAKMATAEALHQAQGLLTMPHSGSRRTVSSFHAAEEDLSEPIHHPHGAAPVRATAGFAQHRERLPRLSLSTMPPSSWHVPSSSRLPRPGVYAIVDTAERVSAVIKAGAHTVQLRIKTPPNATLAQTAWIEAEIRQAHAYAQAAQVTLYVNDHWRQALRAGAQAIHLGQEDMLTLEAQDIEQLQAARQEGLRLGLSSHSLWELCRALTLQPDYVACGPVWPTTTKEMPWQPQGLSNLSWWSYMSPVPVVAIGGILRPEQLEACIAAGAAGVCILRGIGSQPVLTLPGWLAAWEAGSRQAMGAIPKAPGFPSSSLEPVHHHDHVEPLPFRKSRLDMVSL